MKYFLSLMLVALCTLGTLMPTADAYYPRRGGRVYDHDYRYNYVQPTYYYPAQQPQTVYVYQTIPYAPVPMYSNYPGCGADIVIGSQVWASCNVVSRGNGATDRSGWFFANDMYSSFVSYNGMNQGLTWQGKVYPSGGWGDGPCADGYRLPTVSEWQTAMYYARLNNTSIANLLALPQNGGYRGYRDTDLNVRVEARYDLSAAYWSSTNQYSDGYYYPVALHLGSVYNGYRTDGTDPSRSYNGYSWQYNDSGLQLVAGSSQELANIRCIRK